MLNRVLVAAALLAVVALGFLFAPLRFIPVLGLAFLGLACIHELAAMLRPREVWLSRRVGYVIVAALALLGWVKRLDIAFMALGVGASAALALRLTRQPIAGAWRDASATMGATLYVGLPIAGLIELFVVSSASRGWLLFLLGVVWLTDTCALFAGKAMGRTKIFPIHSPKKTWEGTLGGIAGSMVSPLLARASGGEAFAAVSDLELVLVALVFSVLTQIGDVAESMLKRDAEVKDSGTLLGGHGGALDRLDSLLFVTMPFYFYLILFRPGVISLGPG